MKKFFSKIIQTIVPHEKNGNVPHILREEFMIVLVFFVGVLFYFNQHNFDIIKKLNLSATVYPAVLADLANQDRETSSVPTLTWNKILEQAAQMKADDMVKNSYFAHTSPAGITPWYWLVQNKYNFAYAGENLAVDFTESANVENAWLNSPKHRENIMNSKFTEIGIATADGFFEGKNTTFVVEFFGTPSQILISEKEAPAKQVAIAPTTETIEPTVAGATTSNTPKPVPTATNTPKVVTTPKIAMAPVEPKITVINEADKFIAVKNDEVAAAPIPLVTTTVETKPMSTWYERLIVTPTKAIKTIYSILFSLILISMGLMLTKEYQKHHAKHLVMGMAMIFILVLFTYLISANSLQAFFLL